MTEKTPTQSAGDFKMSNCFFNPLDLTGLLCLKLITIFIPCFFVTFFCRFRDIAAFAQHCISLCQLPELLQPRPKGSLTQSAFVIMFSLMHWATQLLRSCQHLLFSEGEKKPCYQYYFLSFFFFVEKKGSH